MVDWKYINDIIVSLRTGLNPRQNFRLNTPESYFPYITGKDIFNNKINVTSVTDKVDSKAVELINKRANLEDNLLLFASTGTGTVGRMAIVDKYVNDWAISETLYAIKTSQAISPQFLMYSLYSYIAKKQYEPKISKGSVPHLKIADLLKVKIPVPSLFEQQRIVEQLDTFTSSIDNLKEQIAQRRKQYEYYRDQLLDFEGKEGVERTILKNVCEVINGRAYSQPELLSEGKYRVLRVGNFFSNDSWYYSDLELEDKYYCEQGDLLYAWSASFGPHIWEEAKTIYHYHIWKMNCSDCLDKKFMFYWLQSEDMRKQAFSNLHGATMAHLTKALMESLLVPIPSLDEQQRIVSILDTFEASVANLEQQLALREKQYEYYRNKLLTFE